MAQQTINIGTTANDGTGDPLRTAFDKVNSNFTELYNDESQGEVNSIIAGDGISVDTATGNVTVTNTITNNNQLINGAGYVDGSGTANKLPKFTDSDTIGNSTITDDGTNVSITGDFTADAIYLNDMTLGSGALYYSADRLTLANYNSTGSVYIETGGGSYAMVLDENQNVGIGTISPTNKLDINGGITVQQAADIKWQNTARDTTFGSISSNASALSFDWAGTEAMRITSGGDISFKDTSNNEAFYWDASTARLGIGTTSPSAALSVTHATTQARFEGSAQGNVVIRKAGTGGMSLFSDAAGTLAIYDNDAIAERMRIDSSGIVGIGLEPYTSAGLLNLKGSGLALKNDLNGSNDNRSLIQNQATTSGSSIDFISGQGLAMTIAHNKNVGIGTSSPARDFHLHRDTLPDIHITNSASGTTSTDGATLTLSNLDFLINNREAGNLLFRTSDTERMRIDSSGRVGIGTTIPATELEVNGDIGIGRTSGGYTFRENVGGGLRASMKSSSSNELIFSVDADAEAMRIKTGNVLIGKTSANYNSVGSTLYSSGLGEFVRDSGVVLNVNRKGNDGTLVSFFQDGVGEGSITVSGNTVSYNNFLGSHYSEGVQNVLRGTVLESIDELVENNYEHQNRLPKCKISDTEDSISVYGVWGGNDELSLVSSVGAFLVRINSNVVVKKGDLLSSNGDGTAKIQDDDIIRSKTIGKVTASIKVETYQDGSYLVPAVLYCG